MVLGGGFEIWNGLRPWWIYRALLAVAFYGVLIQAKRLGAHCLVDEWNLRRSEVDDWLVI